MNEQEPSARVEFFFEFASPYSYLSSEVIEGLCDEMEIDLWWRPIMLGPILKRTGSRPLYQDGLRGDYAHRDCLRWARRQGTPFTHWAAAPVNSLKAARGAYWLAESGHQAAFIHACFRAHFGAGLDLYDDGVLGKIVIDLGLDAREFAAGITRPEIKRRLAEETEAAWQRGVFGAPTFFWGDEMLWGNDRLPLLTAMIREQRRPEPN